MPMCAQPQCRRHVPVCVSMRISIHTSIRNVCTPVWTIRCDRGCKCVRVCHAFPSLFYNARFCEHACTHVYACACPHGPYYHVHVYTQVNTHVHTHVRTYFCTHVLPYLLYAHGYGQVFVNMLMALSYSNCRLLCGGNGTLIGLCPCCCQP